jgi:hypothetical protein
MVATATLVGGTVAVGALGQDAGAPPAPTRPPTPVVQADRLTTTPTAARVAAPPTVQLRPLRSTTFRIGLVNPATHVDRAAVTTARVDLVTAWAAGDLADQLGTGWSAHRGIAWRTDTWRLVGTRRLQFGDERVPMVRLANRKTQRWLWVAALPRDQAVRPVQRQLAALLRPGRTPWLVVATARDRFSGEGLTVLHTERQDAGLRVGRLRVPAG